MGVLAESPAMFCLQHRSSLTSGETASGSASISSDGRPVPGPAAAPSWLPHGLAPDRLIGLTPGLGSPRQIGGRSVANAVLQPMSADGSVVIQAAMPSSTASVEEVLSFLGMLITHDVRELLVVRERASGNGPGEGAGASFLDPIRDRDRGNAWSVDLPDHSRTRAFAAVRTDAGKPPAELQIRWEAPGPQLLSHRVRLHEIDLAVSPGELLLRLESFCNGRDARTTKGQGAPVAVAGAWASGASSAVLVLLNELLAQRELHKSGASRATTRALSQSPQDRRRAMQLQLLESCQPLPRRLAPRVDDGLRLIAEAVA